MSQSIYFSWDKGVTPRLNELNSLYLGIPTVWNSVENGSEMLEIIVVNTLLLFCHYLPSEKSVRDPLFKHIEFPLQRNCFLQGLVEIGTAFVLEEKILKIRQCLFNMSSFGKGCWPIFEQICIYFCFKCLKLFQWFWRGIPIFKFHFVAIVSAWQRAWLFIWTNLCRIIFVKGDWLKLITPVVLIGKEDF